MCFNSIILYGIDFQYKDYKEIIQKVDSTKGYDCMIYIDNNWRDIYTYFPIKLNYDEIYYLQENNIANIDNILEQRKTKNNLVIDLPSYLSLENQVLIMDKILKKTKYKEYYLIYSTEYSDIYGLF